MARNAWTAQVTGRPHSPYSGFFIIVADAWMQHPVAFLRTADGMFQVTSFWGLLLNPWALIQYSHNMCHPLITGAFVMSARIAAVLFPASFS
jgi:cytochrome bd-type quinol oxidase subunit 1